jgi:hypothetical protein
MFGNNKFLNDFVKMRSTLHTEKPTSKKSMEQQPVSSISIMTIIEKKPPIKDVINFFKTKAEAIKEV